MLIHLQRQNYVTWACGVRNVLYMYGFGYVWEAQGVGDVNSFIACFRKRLIDCASQNWHASIASHDFYKTYSNFKQEASLTSYLVLIKNFFVRRALTRFRFGMSDLNCRSLQYKSLDQSKCFCPFCTSVYETEMHFLLVCPVYSDLRREFIPQKYYRNPNMARFTLLMACVAEGTIKKLSIFIYKALILRSELVRNIQAC